MNDLKDAHISIAQSALSTAFNTTSSVWGGEQMEDELSTRQNLYHTTLFIW